MKISRNFSHLLSWLSIMVFLALAVFLVQNNLKNYQANIASRPAPVFDGTVMPIQKSLDWVNTPAPEWKLSYSEVDSSNLVDIFRYDPVSLDRSTQDLKWGNAADNEVRNMKITYSVPYMGNYKLGAGEHTGSHLAVDIKAIKGTPVYAVANGVVVKASNQTYGFGQHVVVKHENVPALDDSSKKITLYSSYSHLDRFIISDGDVVSKGQLIGYVGDTGTATTDHLHFQIDTASAPWHPYWPFTSKEASDAGYNFTEAINNGLGRESALANTINPLMWVQKNMTSQPSIIKNSEPTEVTSDTSDSKDDNSEIGRVLFFHDLSQGLNDTFNVRIKLLDQDANDMISPDFEGTISVYLKNDRIGSLNKSLLDRYDFKDGVATIEVENRREGSTRLIAEYNGDTFSSEEFTVKAEKTIEVVEDKIVNLDTVEFKIDAPLEAIAGDDLVVSIEGFDGRGDKIITLSEQVLLALSNDLATLERTELSFRDFESGKANVMLRDVEEGDFRVIVLYKGAQYTSENIFVKPKTEEVSSLDESRSGGSFSDVAADHKNYKAIEYLRAAGIVQGYDSGKFKPEQSISRVEVLKMILAALDYDLSNDGAVDFSDISNVAWYSPYLATAVDKGIVAGYPDQTFKPTQGVNTAEFFKMAIKASGLEVNEEVGYRPFLDVDENDWYAVYAQFVKNKRLLDSERRYFKPGVDISRAEVAEALYRILIINKHQVKSYREGLE